MMNPRERRQNRGLITRKAFSTLLLCVSLSSCKETLVPLEDASVGVFNYGKVDAHFCTSLPAPAEQKLKYLFILDHSSSNKPGVTIDVGDTQNTDADGSRRYGPMINFINNLNVDDKTTPYFGLIDFDDTARMPAGLSGFESNLSTFLSIATTDWIGSGTALAPAPHDAGFTNYQAALNLALTLIQQDAQAEAAVQSGSPVTSVYQIIFVSDGVPTVQALDSSLHTQVFSTDLQPVIADILALKNTPSIGKYIANVTLNTAYYFNSAEGPKAAAITLLKQMSNAGKGIYEQFATGQQILYQTFAPASRNVKNSLVDVFVQNTNAAWWDDGQFMLDTDEDGLPNLIEKKLGSNSQEKDTDGNGVSDLVEYRTKGVACNAEKCEAIGRDPYSMCAGFEPTTDTNGRITFLSTSNDGMNNCEKFLMNGSTQSFNSSGNLIPDNLAFVNGLSIQPSDSTVALADPFGNGINNYQKLKLGLPLQTSMSQTGEFESRQMAMVVTSVAENGVTCYDLQVDRIAQSSPYNKIKIYLVQNSTFIQDKPFLMVAEKSFEGGANLVFAPEDFK